jgi:ribonuclease J
VDGSSVGDITEAALTDRRILGEEGFISIFVVVDASAGTVLMGPEFHARGFSEDEDVFVDISATVTQDLERAMADGVGDRHQLQQIIRRTVGRWVNTRHRRRPMIMPVVVEE